jgi:UDPglucose--hexose-1-phosphate uridylyltransferase
VSVEIYTEIERLVQYGLKKGLINKWDLDYTRNSLIQVLGLDDYQQVVVEDEDLDSPVQILENILDWAADNGLLEENTVTYRDLLDTKIIGCLVARPSEVIRNFYDTYDTINPQAATQYLYDLSKDVHYVRTDRIAKNEHWFASTDYGQLEITINLSKPEKDPKAIAAAKSIKQSSYPKCLLCKENVGYQGRVNHPARQNLRTIPIHLDDEIWHLQFSPYVYYNEHAIVFLEEHNPMKITKRTFERLLEFVEKLPHYFLGSNADLPIVGGSILSHDHFQGGHHEFPMAKAEIEAEFKIESFPNVRAGIVKWPISVVRLQGKNRQELAELSKVILNSWKEYSDETVGIYAYTDATPHNTITPIARKTGDLFELDLVLRNNRTSGEHPLGIFHPHQEVHHIKKENIGLIEVMGLAVLPGRLQEELKQLAAALEKENFEANITNNDEIAKHIEWARSIKRNYPEFNAESGLDILRKEVGIVFSQILEHAGVFKRNKAGQQAFTRFVDSLNN